MENIKIARILMLIIFIVIVFFVTIEHCDKKDYPIYHQNSETLINGGGP